MTHVCILNTITNKCDNKTGNKLFVVVLVCFL